MHSQEFVERMKERLSEEKENLTEELASLSEHTEVGDETDENASEFQIDEVNHDIAATIKADLEKIEKALKKIEAGTYGITDDGTEISAERLEVLPWADSIVEE
jgi:DnaK suppressor protein